MHTIRQLGVLVLAVLVLPGIAPPLTPPADASGYDPVIELRALIEGEVRGSEAFRANVRDVVTDLQRQLPPELRDFLGENDQAIEETVARIITEGGEDVLARLDGSEAVT